jgi:hypothetical protein
MHLRRLTALCNFNLGGTVAWLGIDAFFAGVHWSGPITFAHCLTIKGVQGVARYSCNALSSADFVLLPGVLATPISFASGCNHN